MPAALPTRTPLAAARNCPVPGGPSAGHPAYSSVLKDAIIRSYKTNRGQTYQQHGSSRDMAESICACQADVLDRNYTICEFANIVERGPHAMTGSKKFKTSASS